MIASLIRWSVKNRLVVLVASVLLAVWGWQSARTTPLDAIPDLSDVQVIIKTPYAGQSPRVVEDQITYPVSTTMLSVPGAKAVRGYSFFGDSYVYVLFEDDTDMYWARSRVLEYLDQAAADLPDGVQPRLGPDATGVGWLYQYALVDESGEHALHELTSLQDWFLRQELQAVPGVAEVATVGGMVRQYQVVADPDRLRAFDISLERVARAIRASNREVGGSVLEMGEAEYMITGRGYLEDIGDLESIPLGTHQGTPVRLDDVAEVRLGPEMRRGIADLDGQGEVVGGIIVMRFGENALAVIDRVKQRLDELADGLPEGVEIKETYDRSDLIHRAVENLNGKLIEEFAVVALVCLIFLFHLRSSLVAIVTLPLGVLAAFIVMKHQGINANIMSLGGIAIAIGAMVDAAIVMIENAHKRLERYREEHGQRPRGSEHWRVITEAAIQVGPALFFSLLIITLSFMPVFTLEAQEGRLFSPLAFTKTYAMAASAGLAVTLVPVLMGYFIRGRIPGESKNPISRVLIWLYRPALRFVLRWPKATLGASILVALSLFLPLAGVGSILTPAKWAADALEAPAAETIADWQAGLRDGWRSAFDGSPRLEQLADGLGSEFMPELNEGDLLYMPTTLPGVSIGKARELLQQTDRLIASLPEVERVFGKIGRARTATDPAPLTMIETTILLKSRDQWRDGMTMDKLVNELDQTVDFPGLTNAWVMPIKTRIDMLATGIKTPVGIKVAGPELSVIQAIGREIEGVLADVPGTASVYSERVSGGRYVEIRPDRARAARFDLAIEDINRVVESAIGGKNLTVMTQGRERYPVNLRYPRAARSDVQSLRELPVITPAGAHVTLGQVAEIVITEGPPVIKTENARINGWTFVDIRDRDVGSYLDEARPIVEEKVDLPPGYSITWSGQFEYMQRAKEKLEMVIPLTLAIVFLLLYLTFRNTAEALMVMLTLPFALVGGFWLLWWLGFDLSVAVAVGFIALAGVAAEFGVVMLVYLDNALADRGERATSEAELLDAIMEGAVARVRPKAMTVAVIVAGLIPIMIGHGTGSEVMQRIAAPMVGGMITAPLLSLFVIPALYLLWRRRDIRRSTG